MTAAFGGAQAATPEQVTVIGLAPENAQEIGPDDIVQSHDQTVPDLLSDNVPSAILSDTEANPFQYDAYFHGFDASPVLGTAIGLAVYQGGTRINERFGDTVLWDLIPTFALHNIDVVSGSEPLYGLNALGGAIVLGMKTGFSARDGVTADVSAGSFGRVRLTAEAARQWSNEAFYAGAMLEYENGWRELSPSELAQAYGDYSIRSANLSAGLSLTLAKDYLNENGAVPLDDFPRAPFSIPDTTADEEALAQAHADYAVFADVHLKLAAYFKATHLQTENGGAQSFVACSSDPALLCSSDDPGDPLTNQNGNTISFNPDLEGTIPIEETTTNATGVSSELDFGWSLLGLTNETGVGGSFDYGHTDFRSLTQLGTLDFIPGGVIVDPIREELAGQAWNVVLHAVNRDEGVYIDDLAHLSPSLSLRLSARLNLDEIDLDNFLNPASGGGHHGYSSLNPAATLNWRVNDLFVPFATVGQSSRIPTAAELSCADPAEPCLFPLSFISDPPLRKVVARSFTLGASGRYEGQSFGVEYAFDAYAVRNNNDILFESSGPLIGSGFFANVGATERKGIDVSLGVTWRWLSLKANYALVDATFRSSFEELSDSNPDANANGDIFVQKGDRLPGIPRSSGRLTLGYQATPKLNLELEADLESSRYLRGDEANLTAPLPGFFVLDADVDYRLTNSLGLYLKVVNLLDRHYATFGLYGDPTAGGVLPFSNPRFIVPAAPFGAWAGIRAQM